MQIPCLTGTILWCKLEEFLELTHLPCLTGTILWCKLEEILELTHHTVQKAICRLFFCRLSAAITCILWNYHLLQTLITSIENYFYSDFPISNCVL